jgi:hypothetical protein
VRGRREVILETMHTVEYVGHDCVPLENGIVRLLVTRSIGLRVLSFGFAGGENMFAVLPDFVTDCPGAGKFHFYGGHRLWRAPEEPALTYLPDNHPVDVAPLADGLLVTQPTDLETGLQKSLEIRLPNGAARVTLTHRIANLGAGEATFAPWAITQFKTGGVAILPQSKEETGVLPNRSLTLWPYSSMTNPNVDWGKHFILVRADMDSAFKVGFPNPRGWLAYWLDGTLFVKRANYHPQAEYCDFGSSSECYCNDRFLELETLAPIAAIPPGATATHIETWELNKNIECPRNEEDAQALAHRLNLT